MKTEENKQEALEEFINSQPYYGSCTTEYLEGIREGAKWQKERMYSEEDMLNFAWFFLKNIGQYSDDKLAHFQGEYLKQFKKKL